MTDSNPASVQDLESAIAEIRLRFQSASPKNQQQMIPELMGNRAGEAVLRDYLKTSSTDTVNLVAGQIYQTLYNANSPENRDFLQTHFPTGLIPLRSSQGIDYAPLQQSLLEQDFQKSDRLTLDKLCELAGDNALERKWLYFTQVQNFPIPDLQTIDNLWLIHSGGKFGFSVQREIWLGSSKNFPTLWEKIGWRKGNNWTRYPYEFTWDLTAPRGHLPLSNQLRGVRVISSLLTHPAWNN